MSAPAIHSTFAEDTARARRTDPITSHEAADVNDVASSIGAVLDLLRAEGPMIDELIESRLLDRGCTFTGQRLRTAREALVRQDLVHHNGSHQLTSRGRRSQVWAAGPAPREVELEPIPDSRRCGACGVESVVEVNRWREGDHLFEAWKCADPACECGRWNDREVRQ